MSAGGAMRWRVVLEVVGAEGTTEAHEVGTGARAPTGHTAATLGLGLEGVAARFVKKSTVGKRPCIAGTCASRRPAPKRRPL